MLSSSTENSVVMFAGSFSFWRTSCRTFFSISRPLRMSLRRLYDLPAFNRPALFEGLVVLRPKELADIIIERKRGAQSGRFMSWVDGSTRT